MKYFTPELYVQGNSEEDDVQDYLKRNGSVEINAMGDSTRKSSPNYRRPCVSSTTSNASTTPIGTALRNGQQLPSPASRKK